MVNRNKKKLRLNKDKKKFLGVCAGIADYLGVESWVVRLVFLVAVFMGAWFLIPIYFICWFCMDTKSGGFKQEITDNPTVKHFKNVDYKKKLYRNTQEAKFLGICAGIADYLEVDVTIVRLVTVLLLFIAGPIPWLAYFAAYFLLDKKPMAAVRAEGEDEHGGADGERPVKRFYSTRKEFKHCERKFVNLQRRLERMEAYVTSPQFKLHQAFREI